MTLGQNVWRSEARCGKYALLNYTRSLRIGCFLCLVMVLLKCNVHAQDNRSVRTLKSEADHYYEAEQYNLSIQYYREIADFNGGDADIAYRLAECYRRTFNYPEGEVYYLKTHYLAPEKHPLALYYYALMLKLNGNFEEAMQYFSEFILLHQDRDLKEYVEQAVIDRSGCQAAREALAANTAGYPSIALPLNTRYNDFAPAVRDSLNLVITSGRISSNRQSIDERYGEAFTDNYYYQKAGDTWTDKTRQLFTVMNTRYNDGSGCFNRDGTKYYLTVCGANGPQCRIFVATFNKDKWTEPVALNDNINHGDYESRQPAISMGGDSLVFVSNRPGGAGGFDLWLSINSGGERWGPAVNLGPAYNTKLHEVSPAFTPFPNVLFFASDGHEGFGGLDLYMAKRLSTGEIMLHNLGLPFNSNRDDAFMCLDQRSVYWSSNRVEGLGGFDVMAVRIPSVASFISRIGLKNRNARRDIMLSKRTESADMNRLQASRIDERIDYDKLSTEKKQMVQRMVELYASNKAVDRKEFNVSDQEFAQLEQIARDRYAGRVQNAAGYSRISVPVSDNGASMVTAVIKDSLTRQPVADARVALMDANGQILKISQSNKEGRVRFTGVDPGSFLLRAEQSMSPASRSSIADVRITAPAVANVVQMENIYFDFDHYRLRSEAILVVDQLAEYLVRTPAAQLEVFAYADDVGSVEYNMKLSQKRGQSVVDYLRRKGVDQTSIVVVAKGRQLAEEVDRDAQRQYNRRVEFALNGITDFKPSARTVLLRKPIELSTLSQQSGVSVSQISALNGISGDQKLRALQPLRLPVEAIARLGDVVIR